MIVNNNNRSNEFVCHCHRIKISSTSKTKLWPVDLTVSLKVFKLQRVLNNGNSPIFVLRCFYLMDTFTRKSPITPNTQKGLEFIFIKTHRSSDAIFSLKFRLCIFFAFLLKLLGFRTHCFQTQLSVKIIFYNHVFFYIPVLYKRLSNNLSNKQIIWRPNI